jgi:plastocyanin
MRVRIAVPVLTGLLVFTALTFVLVGRPARVAGQQAPRGHSGHATMTDAAMKRWADAWWASHPRVGTASRQAAAATFTVENFRFDADGNAATQIDTVHILEGEAVTWQWIIGIHSVTNGTGVDDPNAGTVFDQPISSANPQFTFTFTSAGTFPFFCRPHELELMKGVVEVGTATGVKPFPGGALGFTGGPRPNPTRTGVTFGFALRQPGRVLAEVFDARGRRVATVLDRDLGAGSHVGAWDGRTSAGKPAETGLYYLRLRLPGYERSRAIAITR